MPLAQPAALPSTVENAKLLPYRCNIGIVLVNRDGKIFIGKRRDQPDPTSGWQMPQGGIDAGEDRETALWRELQEEVGTRSAEIMAAYPRPVLYDFPPEFQPQIYGGHYRGQQQYWFLLRFMGAETDINITATHGEAAPEFSAYRWEKPAAVVELAVPFKRAIYENVLYYFAEYIGYSQRA
jgi:putative (di)nucleoside polyphosphate hydrolase